MHVHGVTKEDSENFQRDLHYATLDAVEIILF